MGILSRIKRGLDWGLETLVALVMGVLVLDVTWQVMTRFVLRDPSSWTEELATFLMIWVGLLGASVALKRGAHLGIDYFVSHLPPRARQASQILVFVSTGLFSLGVLCVGGTVLVARTLWLDQVSPALGIRMGYVYLALPISGAFLTLYSLEFLIETMIALVKGEAAAEPGADAVAKRGAE